MTILTKPSSGAKLNDKPIDPETGAIIEQDGEGSNEKLFFLRERSRPCTGSTILLILATLCLACMGILACIVYRRAQLNRMHFRGLCSVPLDGIFDGKTEKLNALNRKYHNINPDNIESIFDEIGNDEDDFFRQEFELDFDQQISKSKIKIPDFNDGKHIGRFLHDFKSNQTAIIDENGDRCFVMPLDREAILPPKSLADVILKMYSGYYDVNTQAIRKKMYVVTPALTDLSTISPNIQIACKSMNIYRLAEQTEGIVKRNVHQPIAELSEFTGNLVNYEIHF